MDKRALLKQRGQEAIRQILVASGGVYTRDQVAALLEISEEEVLELVEQGGLLVIELGGEHGFPKWQFDENGIVPRFAEILGILETSSPVGVIRFFLSQSVVLGCPPIKALKSNMPNQVEMVRLLAQQFNQQVAR